METSFEEGVRLVRHGNHARAVQCFTCALEESSEEALVLYFRSLSLYLLGDSQAALHDIARIVELKPSCPVGWWNRALLHANSSQVEAALSDLTRAVEVYNTDSATCNLCAEALDECPLDEVFTMRGQLLLLMDRYEESIVDLSAAIKLNGENHDALSARGQSHSFLGNESLALADFSRAIALCATEPRLFWWRSQIFHGQGEIDRCLSDLHQFLELSPDDSCALILRASLYLQIDEIEAGLNDANHALCVASQKEAPAVYEIRGRLYWHTGEYEQAIQDFDQCMRSSEDVSATVLVLRGMSKSVLRDSAGAVFDLTRALTLGIPDEHFGDVCRHLAESHFRLGSVDDAMKYSKLAIAAGADELEDCYFVLANCCAVLDDHEGAIAQFTESIRLRPTANSYFNRGNSYSSRGLYAEAVSDFSQALLLEPEMFEAYANRGIARESLGELFEALCDYDRGLRIRPTDSVLLKRRQPLLRKVAPGVCDLVEFRARKSARGRSARLSTFELLATQYSCIALDMAEMLVKNIEARVGPQWRCRQSDEFLTFSSESGGRQSLHLAPRNWVVPLQVLASHNIVTNTWLWAWGDPAIEEECASYSSRLRILGKQRGVEEFCTPELSVDSSSATQLTSIAAGLLRQAVFAVDTGDVVVYVLVDVLRLDQDSDENLIDHIHRIYSKALNMKHVFDPLLMLTSYLEVYGVEYQRTQDSVSCEDPFGNFLICEARDNKVEVRFGTPA